MNATEFNMLLAKGVQEALNVASLENHSPDFRVWDYNEEKVFPAKSSRCTYAIGADGFVYEDDDIEPGFRLVSARALYPIPVSFGPPLYEGHIYKSQRNGEDYQYLIVLLSRKILRVGLRKEKGKTVRMFFHEARAEVIFSEEWEEVGVVFSSQDLIREVLESEDVEIPPMKKGGSKTTLKL